MSHKWHYFNEKDELCKFKSPWKDITYYKTYCSRDANWVIEHTEDPNQVTCINCLRRLNLCLTK